MRSFALFTAALASLSAVVALPVGGSLPAPPPPVGGSVSELGGGLTGVGKDVSLTGPTRRCDACSTLPEIFGDLNLNVQSYLNELSGCDQSSDADEVNGVFLKLEAALGVYLEELRLLEGKQAAVVLATAEGVVLDVTVVATEVVASLNIFIAAVVRILVLDIAADVKVRLIAALGVAVGVVEEAVIVVPALLPCINGDIVDSTRVIAELGIALKVAGLIL